MTGFWADLGELVRNPRAWWHRATHVQCSVCGQEINSRQWADSHGHSLEEWRTAVAARTGTPEPGSD